MAGYYETLDPGIVPGPACLEQKPMVFAQEARHLRRRGTSLCLAIHSYRFMARGRAERDGKLVSRSVFAERRAVGVFRLMGTGILALGQTKRQQHIPLAPCHAD